MRARGIIAAIVLALSGVAAVAQTRRVRQRDPAWIAPPSAVAKTNPLARRPETEAGGAKVFRERCANCHALDGGGTEYGPDLGAPGVQAQSDGALFWKISGGDTRGGMPSFSFLPELQRWQLVLHVRTLDGPGGPR